MHKSIYSATLFALGLVLTASPAAAEDDLQMWQTLTINHDLSSKVRSSLDITVRSRESNPLFDIETAAMLGYRVNHHITIWAGVVFDPTFIQSPVRVDELRLRQQVSFDNVVHIGKVSVSGRLRLEYRWRSGVNGEAWRLRPQIKLSLPLHGKASLSLTHEDFFDLDTTSFQPVRGHERMRNAVYVTLPLARRFSLDVGYLNQQVYFTNKPRNIDHTFTTGLGFSF